MKTGTATMVAKLFAIYSDLGDEHLQRMVQARTVVESHWLSLNLDQTTAAAKQIDRRAARI